MITSIQNDINSQAIETIWFSEKQHIDITSIAIPYTKHELILNIGDTFTVSSSKKNGATIFSPIQTNAIQTKVQGKYQAFGVMFNPIGMYETYGLSIAECKALSISSSNDLLFGKKEELLQKIQEADSATKKLSLFSSLFFQHSPRKNCPPLVVNFIRTISALADNPIAIKDIATHLNYSSKHLISTFKDVVGITPKKYVQLVQLNRTLLSMKLYPQKKLTEIALEHGFYDQAHYIRVFKKFSGITPYEFRVRQTAQAHPFINTILW